MSACSKERDNPVLGKGKGNRVGECDESFFVDTLYLIGRNEKLRFLVGREEISWWEK